MLSQKYLQNITLESMLCYYSKGIVIEHSYRYYENDAEIQKYIN